MFDADDTSAAALIRAAAIGRDAGLRYVYGGNLGYNDGNLENTWCASCGVLLIERRGLRVMRNRITPEGFCPACRARIPGVWRLDTGQSKARESLIHARCG